MVGGGIWVSGTAVQRGPDAAAFRLDAVLPETIRIPGSLPELLPGAQQVAEGIRAASFLQQGLRGAEGEKRLQPLA